MSGITLITWIWKFCTRRNGRDRDESNKPEYKKPRNSVSTQDTETYPVFGFFNGDYQIVHVPRDELSPRPGDGQGKHVQDGPEAPGPHPDGNGPGMLKRQGSARTEVVEPRRGEDSGLLR